MINCNFFFVQFIGVSLPSATSAAAPNYSKRQKVACREVKQNYIRSFE